MNDETVEFITVYIELEKFAPAYAKSASSAAEGLCTYAQGF